MKLKNLFSVVFLFLVIVSCDDTKEKEAALKKYMQGKWQTSYLKVVYQTIDKTDSTYVYEDNFDGKNATIAQSEYFEDGTFNAWFLDSLGNKNGLTKGVWNIKKDSLITSYNYLNRDITSKYLVQQSDSGFTATSLFDWDNDGKEDDLLTMKTIRLK